MPRSWTSSPIGRRPVYPAGPGLKRLPSFNLPELALNCFLLQGGKAAGRTNSLKATNRYSSLEDLLVPPTASSRVSSTQVTCGSRTGPCNSKHPPAGPISYHNTHEYLETPSAAIVDCSSISPSSVRPGSPARPGQAENVGDGGPHDDQWLSLFSDGWRLYLAAHFCEGFATW